MTLRWTTTGSFSIQSLYQFLNHRGVIVSHPMIWWALPIPPKIKVFMWLTFRNRILSRVNLHKRGWEGDTTSVFCSCNETINHLFLNCQLVRQVLQWIGKDNIDCTQCMGNLAGGF